MIFTVDSGHLRLLIQNFTRVPPTRPIPKPNVVSDELAVHMSCLEILCLTHRENSMVLSPGSNSLGPTLPVAKRKTKNER